MTTHGTISLLGIREMLCWPDKVVQLNLFKKECTNIFLIPSYLDVQKLLTLKGTVVLKDMPIETHYCIENFMVWTEFQRFIEEPSVGLDSLERGMCLFN